MKGPQRNQSETSSERPPRSQTKIEECICRECGTAFQGEVTYLRVNPDRPYPTLYCPPCQGKKKQEEEEERQAELEREREETRQQWRRSCGLPDHLWGKTFENFVRSRNPSARDAAESWAKDYDVDNPKGYPSLLFYSEIPGVGKTHLVAAIINHVIENWKGDNFRPKSPVYFVKGPRLVRRIRATYHLRDGDNTHEREDEVYNELAGVPLLVLDDVGKETPSNFTRETYWYIIDERLTSGLPVIITSRLPLDGPNSLEEVMGEDTVDRVYGMVRGKRLKMKGLSFRREADQE